MSANELARAAMALPLAERVALAQTLWQSIDGSDSAKVASEVDWALGEASRRNDDLSTGVVEGRTHEQVMHAARKAIE